METVPPNFIVCVVGQTGGVYESSWGSIERLNAQGWKGSIHVVPRFVSEGELADFYAACDAVIVPYRRGFATTSTHLRHASEYGKALIVCDQYLIGQIVRDHQLGLLFEPENVEALRQCLLQFTDQPQGWFDKIRENSEKLVADQSWKRIGESYSKLFESITA
jgi:glycosyltransferase involved in cell wall biosynthesis